VCPNKSREKRAGLIVRINNFKSDRLRGEKHVITPIISIAAIAGAAKNPVRASGLPRRFDWLLHGLLRRFVPYNDGSGGNFIEI
jgi:hypothetical protein